MNLSNLLRRAVAEGAASFNAVALTTEKQKAAEEEAAWFEVHEAALILQAARQFGPTP